jgi:uncharacterized protein YcbK (DUF882 family)
LIKFSLRRIVCTATLALGIMSLSGASRAEESVPTVPSISMTSAKPGLIAGIRLKLHHLHTGESIDVAFKEGGRYSDQGVGMLNRFLRDHRTQDTADYDPREFDLLHALLVKLGKPNATIDIVCGYRTPISNNFLRTRSADTGVAEHSQHMLSKAIDIRVPGVSTLKLRNAALALGMGGVGYYPTSQFVHVDVGPVRQWQFGGRPANQMASRGRRHGHGHKRNA